MNQNFDTLRIKISNIIDEVIESIKKTDKKEKDIISKSIERYCENYS